MRTVLLCVFLAVVSSWAFFGNRWTSLQFQKDYLDIDTTKTCNVDTTYISCSLYDGLAYYSTLDTDYVVIAKPRLATILVHAYAPIDSNSYTYQFAHNIQDVIRYEFMKWQEWGILNMTRDSAQKLIDKIVLDTNYIIDCRMGHTMECDVDPTLCRCEPAAAGGVGIPAEDAARLPTKKFQIDQANIPAETPASEQTGDTMSLLDTSAAAGDSLESPLWFSKSTSLAESVALGMHYRVFDMNGVYLRDGVWQGRFDAAGKPVIVRFGNGLIKVFR